MANGSSRRVPDYLPNTITIDKSDLVRPWLCEDCGERFAMVQDAEDHTCG